MDTIMLTRDCTKQAVSSGYYSVTLPTAYLFASRARAELLFGPIRVPNR